LERFGDITGLLCQIGRQIDSASRQKNPGISAGEAQLFLQVEMPSRVYGGHEPTKPVARGRSPINPHADFGPQKINEMITKPRTIRIVRSMVPTFLFISITPK